MHEHICALTHMHTCIILNEHTNPLQCVRVCSSPEEGAVTATKLKAKAA